MRMLHSDLKIQNECMTFGRKNKQQLFNLKTCAAVVD
jgi:hypothetical protein